MKKLGMIILMLFAVLVSSLLIAGKQVTLPQTVAMNTDKGELIGANFLWGQENTCVVTYVIWNNDRTSIIKSVSFVISGDDFVSLVSGFGATMESRLEADIWQDIQNRFELVP